METSRKQRMCLAFVNGIQDTHAESNTHSQTYTNRHQPNRLQMQRSIAYYDFQIETNKQLLSNRVHLCLPFTAATATGINEPMRRFNEKNATICSQSVAIFELFIVHKYSIGDNRSVQ